MSSHELQKQADKIAQEITKIMLDLAPDSKPRVNQNRLKITIPAVYEFADTFKVTTTLKFDAANLGSMTYTREIITDHDVFDLPRPREVGKAIAQTIIDTFAPNEIQNLAGNLLIVAPPKPKEASEASIQESIKEFAARLKILLYRNTVGQFKTAWGGIVHTGLCKGSSDLIGWTQKTITPDMVGTTIAVFTAVECKRKSVKNNTTDNQDDFIEKVLSAGGYAGVATSLEDLLRITKKSLDGKM